MRPIRTLAGMAMLSMLASCTTLEQPDLSSMSFSTDPLVGKFVWHDLVSDDVDASVDFYGQMFDWTFEPGKSPKGERYTLARSNGVYVGGILAAAERDDHKPVSRWLPYVSVEDVDLASAQTEEAGGEILVAPLDVALGRVAVISDPQGAVVGLARSKIGDPDDATTAAFAGRVIWNELMAVDDSAALAFYSQLADYGVVEIPRAEGEYLVLTGAGIDRAGLFQFPLDGNPAVWLTHFAVADPASSAARAETLGGRILLEPSPDLRDGNIAVITDPTGAVLVLHKWPE